MLLGYRTHWTSQGKVAGGFSLNVHSFLFMTSQVLRTVVYARVATPSASMALSGRRCVMWRVWTVGLNRTVVASKLMLCTELSEVMTSRSHHNKITRNGYFRNMLTMFLQRKTQAFPTTEQQNTRACQSDSSQNTLKRVDFLLEGYLSSNNPFSTFTFLHSNHSFRVLFQVRPVFERFSASPLRGLRLLYRKLLRNMWLHLSTGRNRHEQAWRHRSRHAHEAERTSCKDL